MKPKDWSFISMDGLYAENTGAIFCLAQGFTTKKMVVSRLALREFSYEACISKQFGYRPSLSCPGRKNQKNTGTVTSLKFMMQYRADIRIMICIQSTMRRYP